MKISRYTMFVLTMFMVLALSAMSVVPALADDGVPPPDAPAEVAPPESGDAPSQEESPAEEIPVVEDVPAADESPAEEVPVVEEIPAAEESPIVEENPAAEPETLPEIAEQIPEGTEVVVLDAEGEAVPLATEEAAEVIIKGDPQWCPAGTAPGSATCSGPKDSFNGAGGLIAWINANVAKVGKAGTIWIAWDYDFDDTGTFWEGDVESTAPIDLNGDALASGAMDGFALTIQGGWNGTPLSTALKADDPLTDANENSSYLSVPLVIAYWNAAITINNITITGATGVGGYALDVMTTGNITLNNVDVVNNTMGDGVSWDGGAILDNTSGTNGNIVVNNSSFNDNTGDGLAVFSNGTITAKDLNANGNTGKGAYLNNANAPTPKAVTLNGANSFSYNQGQSGLIVYSRGAITLNNVTAVGNSAGDGVYVDNCFTSDGSDGYFYCTNNVASAVNINGYNTFNSNGWNGLWVESSGAIKINNVVANYNGFDPSRPGYTDDTYDPDIDDYSKDYDARGKGAYLNNYGARTAQTITIAGTNEFSYNNSAGLFALGWGAVTASNLTANENGDYYDGSAEGCDDVIESASLCDGVMLNGSSVTQTGYGTFIGNYDDGMYAGGWLPVILNNLYAEYNGWWGVGAGSGTSVTVNGVNYFNENGASGLYIKSDGTVTLNNITSNGNGEFGEADDNEGVYIDNRTGKWNYNATLGEYVFTPAAKAVILNGASTLNDNHGDGLFVLTYGAITTNGITANGNGGNGAYLDNFPYDDIEDAYYSVAGQAVNVNLFNTMSGNSGNGLEVHSNGAINVNNLTVNGNYGGYGAYLDNYRSDLASAGKLVAVKGYIIANDNPFGFGLYVESLGAITAANITANNNGLDGVVIDNNWFRNTGTVTLTGYVNTTGNYDSGLQVFSTKMITVSNITANGNGDAEYEFGAVLNNTDGGPTLAPGITVNGVNTFNDNFNTGLNIGTFGAVIVNKVTANNNGADYDVNTNPNPWGLGVAIDNRVEVDDGFGNYVTSNKTAKPVTINGYAMTNDNLSGGLFIETLGAVLTNNLTARRNGGNGAYIDNQWGWGKVNYNVTLNSLNGANVFNDNISTGLVIYTHGNILTNNITANGNDGSTQTGAEESSTGDPAEFFVGGMYVYSWSLTATAPTVTLNGFNTFNSNVSDGLVITTTGSITVNNLTANYNQDGNGAILDNCQYDSGKNACDTPSGKPITLKGFGTFIENYYNGLVFGSNGAVSLTRVTTRMNGYDGVYGISTGAIVFTCGSLVFNGTGYNLTSPSITLKGVYTYGNTNSNVIDPASVVTSYSRSCPLP